MKKAKVVLLFLCTLLCSSFLFAQTYVSGLISSDTIWYVNNSPYVVTGNLLVSNNVTLTIMPEVIVKFEEDILLQINGTLKARGTIDSLISFTSYQTNPSPGDWSYILFTDTSSDATYDANGNYISGCIMEYCLVEYADGPEGSVRIDNCSPFINYCTVRFNSTTGINAYFSNLKVTNCTIIDNSDGGIRIERGCYTIYKNTISNNSSYFGGGIYADYFCNINITYNNIVDNNASIGSGIYTRRSSGGWANSSANISENIIINNFASSQGGGIYAYVLDSENITN